MAMVSVWGRRRVSGSALPALPVQFSELRRTAVSAREVREA